MTERASAGVLRWVTADWSLVYQRIHTDVSFVLIVIVAVTLAGTI